jgi:hypothetical protein
VENKGIEVFGRLNAALAAPPTELLRPKPISREPSFELELDISERGRGTPTSSSTYSLDTYRTFCRRHRPWHTTESLTP